MLELRVGGDITIRNINVNQKWYDLESINGCLKVVIIIIGITN